MLLTYFMILIFKENYFKNIYLQNKAKHVFKQTINNNFPPDDLYVSHSIKKH